MGLIDEAWVQPRDSRNVVAKSKSCCYCLTLEVDSLVAKEARVVVVGLKKASAVDWEDVEGQEDS
jgi:hypothetical protein